MSINAITDATAITLAPVSAGPAITLDSGTATSAGNDASVSNPYLITGTTSQTNADGTITIVTTYANGSTSSTPALEGSNTSAANPQLITGTTSQTHPDGTITIVTTYASGATSSTTEINPHLDASQELLSESNVGQSVALLKAQERSQQNAATATHTATHPNHEQLGTLLSAQG